MAKAARNADEYQQQQQQQLLASSRHHAADECCWPTFEYLYVEHEQKFRATIALTLTPIDTLDDQIPLRREG